MSNLLALPDPVWRRLFPFLSVRELGFSIPVATGKFWKHLAADADDTFRSFYIRLAGIPEPAERTETWLKQCRRMMEIDTMRKSNPVQLAHSSDRVSRVAIMPIGDDTYLVSSCFDGSLKLWHEDAKDTFRCVQSLVGSSLPAPDGITDMCVAGERLMSCANDRSVRVWVFAAAQQEFIQSNVFACDTGLPTCICFCPKAGLDSEHLLVAGTDVGTLCSWNITKGSSHQQFIGHTNTVWSMVVVARVRLVTCSLDMSVRVWALGTGAALSSFVYSAGLCCMRVSQMCIPLGLDLGGSAEGTECQRAPRIAHANLVVCGSASGAVPVFPMLREAGVESVLIPVVGEAFDTTGRLPPVVTISPHVDDVTVIEMVEHPLGIYVISGSDDATVAVSLLPAGSSLQLPIVLHRLEGHRDLINSISVAAGTFIFSCSDDGSIRIWDMHSGQHVGTLCGHEDSVMHAQVGRDALISGSDDGCVCVWPFHT
jgi:WD40 repeat protein